MTTPQFSLATSAVKLVFQDNLIATKKGFYQYDSGIWRFLEKSEVRSRIFKAHPEHMAKSANFLRSIVALMEDSVFQPSLEFNEDRECINAGNGTLRFDYDLKKMRLDSHRKEDFFTLKTAANFIENPSAPFFEILCHTWFGQDDEGKKKRTLLLEIIGYTCAFSTALNRFFVFQGVAGSGKSTILWMIEKILNGVPGSSSVCHIQPELLNNRFHRAYLQDKLANLVAEIDSESWIDGNELKSFASGDGASADHKFKQIEDFRPFAKHIFCCNEKLPKIKNREEALRDRICTLIFDRRIRKTSIQISETILRKRVSAELDSIFSMAVNAFGEVLNRGDFTSPASSEDFIRKWFSSNDFIENLLVEFGRSQFKFMPESKVELQRVFDRLKKFWSEELGNQGPLGMGVKEFKRRLLAVFAGKIDIRKADANYNWVFGIDLIE